MDMDNTLSHSPLYLVYKDTASKRLRFLENIKKLISEIFTCLSVGVQAKTC